MGRLSQLPSRMGGLPGKLRPMPKVADRFYQSADWKALREAKRAQGSVYCVVCGAGGRLILDHREERKDGGADLPELSKLDWYCTGCHNRKTAEAKARRARGDR